MTDFSLTTPALLFPAISLLLLAYTNRFLHLAALIRDLHARYNDSRAPILRRQIEQLRHRLLLVRNMQWLGVASIFGCVLCMLLVFEGFPRIASWIFAFSLTLLLLSLAFSMWEIQLSVGALNLQLSDLEDSENAPREPSATIDAETQLGRFP